MCGGTENTGQGYTFPYQIGPLSGSHQDRLACRCAMSPLVFQAKHGERVQVKQICSLVSVRSARLIAAAICGIISHLQRDKPKHEGERPPRNCVAVDGGVLVRYRFYRELLVQGVRETLGDAVADQACTPPCLSKPLCMAHLPALENHTSCADITLTSPARLLRYLMLHGLACSFS